MPTLQFPCEIHTSSVYNNPCFSQIRRIDREMALLRQESELFVTNVLANPENSHLTNQDTLAFCASTRNTESLSEDNLFCESNIFQNTFEDLDLEPIMGHQSSVMAQFS